MAVKHFNSGCIRQEKLITGILLPSGNSRKEHEIMKLQSNILNDPKCNHPADGVSLRHYSFIAPNIKAVN